MNLKNPLLVQMVRDLQSKVRPEYQNSAQRIITAGEKVMYSDQMRQMMINQIKSSPDISKAVGEGVAKLFGLLLHSSKGTLNMKAAIPAMTALLCEALQFVEDAGIVKVNPSLLAAATKEMVADIMQILGVTPQKLQSMLASKSASPQASPGIVSSAQGA